MKTWEFISSSLKNERDVDLLDRSKSPGAAWRTLVETYTPRIDGASLTVLDEVDNFRMSWEEDPVDELLRLESLQRKILPSNRAWSNYTDVLVRAKLVNALPRE